MRIDIGLQMGRQTIQGQKLRLDIGQQIGRQTRQGQQLRIDIVVQIGRQTRQGQQLRLDDIGEGCRWEDRLIRATVENSYRTADGKTD